MLTGSDPMEDQANAHDAGRAMDLSGETLGRAGSFPAAPNPYSANQPHQRDGDPSQQQRDEMMDDEWTGRATAEMMTADAMTIAALPAN